jgi:hypothetical protein
MVAITGFITETLSSPLVSVLHLPIVAAGAFGL